MKKWLRPSMLVMALLALFALAAPSLSWACPVTGRSGDATTVCDRASQSAVSVAMPCCAKMKAQGTSCLLRCCQSVPQMPGGDEHTGITLSQTHADTSSILSQLSHLTRATLIAFALPSAPLLIEPTSEFASGATPSEGTYLPSQYAPATYAGRAPPLS